MQVGRFEEFAVGRHLVARFHNDDIAYHHLSAWYLNRLTLAEHLHGLLLAQLGEHIKLAGSIALKDETYGGCQQNSKDDTHRLNEVLLDESQDQ